MIGFSITDLTPLVVFWLAFTRWIAVLMQLPLYDSNSIPAPAKVFSAFVITFAFYDYTAPFIHKEINYIGENYFWILTIFHTLAGLFIGAIVKMIMNTFIAAGTIITMQVGFGATRYFDPSMAQQIGPFEKLIQWTLIVMIVSSGALIPMFKGIMISFSSINILDFSRLATSPQFFLEFFKDLFVSGVLLSTPFLFANMLLTLVMGIVARMVPQMNILMVSFVVNIGVGLLLFATVNEEFFHVAQKIYINTLGKWFLYIT